MAAIRLAFKPVNRLSLIIFISIWYDMRSKQIIITFILFVIDYIFFAGTISAQGFVSTTAQKGAFTIVSQNAASIYTDENDDWLVRKTAELLQGDIEKVTGKKPRIIHQLPTDAGNLIIIGSIKKSSALQKLILAKKINTDSIKTQWEGLPGAGNRQALQRN